VEKGWPEIRAGPLLIEAHMLDVDCFSFLSSPMEDVLSPILIMTSHQGMAKVRGTDKESPHRLSDYPYDRLQQRRDQRDSPR